MLPPKAISALVNIKKELLSTPDPKKESTVKGTSSTSTRMRHAKAPNAYQRWRQRHDCW